MIESINKNPGIFFKCPRVRQFKKDENIGQFYSDVYKIKFKPLPSVLKQTMYLIHNLIFKSKF